MNITDLESNRKRRLLVKTGDNESAKQKLAESGHSSKMLAEGILELTDVNAVKNPEEINSLLVKSGNVPSQLLVEEEELEDYFLRLVGMDGG
jgi:ABC-2 type transport system ATP-binding protein